MECTGEVQCSAGQCSAEECSVGQCSSDGQYSSDGQCKSVQVCILETGQAALLPYTGDTYEEDLFKEDVEEDVNAVNFIQNNFCNFFRIILLVQTRQKLPFMFIFFYFFF